MEQERCCCSKESTGSIPILRVISKLDSLLAKNDAEGAERLLKYWESEARALNDRRGLLEILSEEIGFYRTAGNGEAGLRAVDSALNLLGCLDGGDSVSYATVYLNCATTMKAFGKTVEALKYYEKAREAYVRYLPADDFRFAGFYNNYATAMVELKRFAEARECYFKAIEILKGKGDPLELAVTYVNLAQLSYDEKEGVGFEDEADGYLQKAYALLDSNDAVRDGAYANVCRKCAPAFEFFGYFLEKSELENRAKQIYERTE